MSATDQLGSDVVRMMKDHLRSWRHSADTGANARGSKVIAGLIHDSSMHFLAVIRSQKTPTNIERVFITIFFTQSFGDASEAYSCEAP
jgi:hypothetical protein